MIKFDKGKMVERLFLGMLIVTFLALVIVNIVWGEHWINSDMSAELIFAKLLKDEGKWIATTSWYYSTEFRVLYTQLVMVPLLYIFEDWTVVRILTNLCFYVGMFASYAYVCKQVSIQKKYLYATALGLFVPFSETMMTHVQMGNTYMSHIILIFLCYGIFLQLSKNAMGKYKAIGVWTIYLVFSFVLGLSGVRYLLDIYVPIMITACVAIVVSEPFKRLRERCDMDALKACCKQQTIRYFIVGLAGSIVAAIGYLYNAVIVSTQYEFQTYSETSFITIQGGVLVERLQNTFGALLQLLGYIENKSFISLHGLITFVAFVLLVMLIYIWRMASKGYHASQVQEVAHDSFTIYFVAVTFLLHVFIFVFTTSTMVDRYFIPILIFMLPVIALYMQKVQYSFDRYVVAAILLGCLGLMGMKTIYSFACNDKNADRYDVVEYLEAAGYTFGYASYWNGNITTELSDGAIEIANLWTVDSLGDFMWSSAKASYEPKSGAIFLLISKDELWSVERHGIDQTQEVVYENDSYMVYHFDEQADFLEYRAAEQNGGSVEE